MHTRDNNLQSYFLGALSGSEAEQIELNVIEDENFANELGAAEGELVEDFLDGRLSAGQLTQFNEHYLTSVPRHRFVKEISVLRNEARRAALSQPANDRNGNLVRGKYRWVFLTAGVIGVCAILLVVLWTRPQADRMTAQETAYAELNRGDSPNQIPQNPEQTFSLVPGTLRDQSGTPRKSGSTTGADFVFRLALPLSEPEDRRYDVSIEANGERTFFQTELPSRQNQSGRELRFLVPSTALRHGRFHITVQNSATNAATATYGFDID